MCPCGRKRTEYRAESNDAEYRVVIFDSKGKGRMRRAGQFCHGVTHGGAKRAERRRTVSEASGARATKYKTCPQGQVLYHGEFDPGSERTLAARFKHASRTVGEGQLLLRVANG